MEKINFGEDSLYPKPSKEEIIEEFHNSVTIEQANIFKKEEFVEISHKCPYKGSLYGRSNSCYKSEKYCSPCNCPLLLSLIHKKPKFNIGEKVIEFGDPRIIYEIQEILYSIDNPYGSPYYKIGGDGFKDNIVEENNLNHYIPYDPLDE